MGATSNGSLDKRVEQMYLELITQVRSRPALQKSTIMDTSPADAVSFLKDKYGTVCFQDENVKAWQRIWGRKILYTSIGGIISTLKQKVHTPVEVNRMYPSTKTCSKCGNIQDIALDERVYICKNKNCGNIMDRDHNSGINIDNKGLKQVGAVRIELTPVEIEANTLMFLRYFNSIPYVKASSVYESGSFTALA